MKEIQLTRGYTSTVDDEDFERVMSNRWQIKPSHVAGKFYAIGQCPSGGMILLHRFILNSPPGLLVDHIDGDGLNNQRANLRHVTIVQNNQYSRKRSAKTTSQYKGVSFDNERKKWLCQIKVMGKMIKVRFDSEIEAAHFYDEQALKHYQEYAYLNFPANPHS